MIQFAQANKKRQNQLDIVYLKGIRCECSIGVWEWEKQLKQTLLIDLELEIDNQQATKNDDLEDALNYQAIAERVQEYAAQTHFNLLETLAERLANVLLDEFNSPRVKLKIDKGAAVKGVKNVGVVIERSASNAESV